MGVLGPPAVFRSGRFLGVLGFKTRGCADAPVSAQIYRLRAVPQVLRKVGRRWARGARRETLPYIVAGFPVPSFYFFSSPFGRPSERASPRKPLQEADKGRFPLVFAPFFPWFPPRGAAAAAEFFYLERGMDGTTEEGFGRRCRPVVRKLKGSREARKKAQKEAEGDRRRIVLKTSGERPPARRTAARAVLSGEEDPLHRGRRGRPWMWVQRFGRRRPFRGRRPKSQAACPLTSSSRG